FNHGESDQIDLTGVSNVHTLADVQALASQVGSDTVINFGGGDTLTLTGVTLANLTAGDFLFTASTNQPPTDLALSSNSVAENSPNGTVVGSLLATDPDAGETFTYSLQSNPGNLFAISGSNLVVNGALDYETLQSQAITVRVTDSASHTFDKAFT